MHTDKQVYNLKVDASGRIVLPADARDRQHIVSGDTVVVVEDGESYGWRTRFRDEPERESGIVPLDESGQELDEVGAGVTARRFTVYLAGLHVKRGVAGVQFQQAEERSACLPVEK